MGEGEREVGVIEVEEGGGDEGVMKEGGLGGVGVEQGGEEVRVERERSVWKLLGHEGAKKENKKVSKTQRRFY